ncbi:hypothetical protein RJ640_015779 [Escallonia rubra]|uniref:Telomerase reverse transcriptase n=1 Tax=Escallonia rubra TaxID=112253 RepID=A0AA88S386_9ASTE|nr:hypothetical protein RJ640_015779 [Escallonia rubra]
MQIGDAVMLSKPTSGLEDQHPPLVLTDAIAVLLLSGVANSPKDIMNSLKPNISGADVLFKDIFGLSHVNISVQSAPCFHSKGSCAIGSNCLYHSLVKLLKILIRKARHCRHVKLLDKHCATSSDQSANQSKSSMFEGYQPETISLGDQFPLENSCGFDAKICEEIPEATAIQFEPSMSYCPKRQVVSYIWAVCRSIVPPDLLGTSPNWRTLRKNISKFVQLRRFEKFSLKQCMHKLKISNFPFLSNKHTSCYLNSHVPKNSKGQHADVKRVCIEVYDAIHLMKQRVFERWIFWFFSCLIMPLIQANFYVTESECGKQEVFYYRKSVWEKLMSRAIISLKDRSYHLLSDVSVRKVIRNRSFGFSRVRLRPKGNGVRPLANLKASSRIPVKQFPLRVPSRGLQRKISLNPDIRKYEYYKPVNGVLRNLHVVLKGIQIEEPEKLGSSVFDYNDIYKKLWPFLSTLKSGLGTASGVFIVVSDVSKAFDSVCQDKLLNVMKDIILKDNYLLKSFSQVLCTKKNLQVRRNLISVHEDITSGSTKFASLVPGRSLDSVVVDQEQSRTLTNEELYFDLNEHVKRNVLQLNRKFYLQNVGIPQGSVLSSLLCSFYYGHLERHVIFPFLERTCIPAGEDLSVGHGHPGTSGVLNRNQDEVISSSPKYMLLRFIDDFLFISTSKKQAAMFFSRLRRGFREYNCYMNEEKFGLNFNIDHIQAFQSNRVYIGEDGISFLRWSGLFINCGTSEIQADYTRYLNSHLSSTLTVCWQDKPGCRLKAKLCDYLRPKCHPIFYDSNINSAAVVRLNIYQAFLLCAMKFHCYVHELSNICRLGSEAFMDVIQRSLRYMHKLIKKRMHSVHIDCNFHPLFRLEKREVEWLGLIAYTRVLKRKQSRYQELLSSLKFKLAANAMAGSVSSALTYAVDDSHSSLIWKIKY